MNTTNRFVICGLAGAINSTLWTSWKNLAARHSQNIRVVQGIHARPRQSLFQDPLLNRTVNHPQIVDAGILSRRSRNDLSDKNKTTDYYQKSRYSQTIASSGSHGTRRIKSYLRKELAKSVASTFMTFFCTFESAMSWFSFFSQPALSIGSSTVSFNSEEYTITFASSTE